MRQGCDVLRASVNSTVIQKRDLRRISVFKVWHYVAQARIISLRIWFLPSQVRKNYPQSRYQLSSPPGLDGRSSCCTTKPRPFRNHEAPLLPLLSKLSFLKIYFDPAKNRVLHFKNAISLRHILLISSSSNLPPPPPPRHSVSHHNTV